MNLFLILGNQLFDPEEFSSMGLSKSNTVFFLREDRELATYYRFHKHKLVFFFASMRSYRDELKSHGFRVHYEELSKENQQSAPKTYEDSLAMFISKEKIASAMGFEIEDKFFETRINLLFKNLLVPFSTAQSPMFLTSREEFRAYLSRSRRPFMKTFYEGQRKRLGILIRDGIPEGGAWSYDSENRLAFPGHMQSPPLPVLIASSYILEVSKMVERNFPEHPGQLADFWLPVDRIGARAWLASFLEERLAEFGPYEDAIPPHSDFLFHSVLTPYLNSGLLTPREVVEGALAFSQKRQVPLPSLEGFIRQVIGWREFVRGVYQNFSEQQDTKNFWNHSRKLSPLWYEGNTGIPPLDETLRRVLKRGYAHHIERLMVVGSLMVLLEVEPKEAHKWFMEMFVDSSDWVMGPNVYGMALFSDGGIFATKPYICGSNYLRKMGGYKKGSWCDGVDGLYWQFVRKNKTYFLKNPRLAMMARTCERLSPDRWQALDQAANQLRAKLVI